MGYIYKIINDINEKVYIGQTINDLSIRWQQHVYDSHNSRENHRMIYRAMNKYGIEHFQIELIEECDDSMLNEREQYWIAYYDSFTKGYNMTRGGDSRMLHQIDVNDVYRLWDQGMSIKSIANQLIGNEKEDNRSTIRKILYSYKNYSPEEAKKRGNEQQAAAKFKAIKQWDKEGNLIAEYESARAAEKDTGIGYKNISLVLNGNSRTAGGYYWTFANQDFNKNLTYQTTKSGGKKHIYMYNLEGEYIRDFSSLKEACIYFGLKANGGTQIAAIYKGIRIKPYKNYYFSLKLKSNYFDVD